MRDKTALHCPTKKCNWVPTITLDDLTPYFQRKTPKAIMKIDIEGSEPVAFMNANYSGSHNITDICGKVTKHMQNLVNRGPNFVQIYQIASFL